MNDNKSILKEIWYGCTDWTEIKSYIKLYFFILKSPVKNTIETTKTIELKDSIKFYLKSFGLYTLLISSIMALDGNEITKAIYMPIKQFVYFAFSIFMNFYIFNKVLNREKSIMAIIVFNTVFGGFLLPIYFPIYLLMQTFAPNPANPSDNIMYNLLTLPISLSIIIYFVKVYRRFWVISFGKLCLVM